MASRSALVLAAEKQMPSRFELVRTTAKLARLVHFPFRERMPDSINRALAHIAKQKVAGNKLPSLEECFGCEGADAIKQLVQDKNWEALNEYVVQPLFQQSLEEHAMERK